MKTLLTEAAMKIIENNFSNDSILRCAAVLKEALMIEGFSEKVSNELAIDGIKITLRTISKLKV